MKKWLSLLLAAAMTLSLIPMGVAVMVSAYSDTHYDYTYKVTNDEATITDVDTAISGTVWVPATLGGCPVTSIGQNALSGCSQLTSVIIRDGVTSIGENAFSGCSQLTSVIIPDSVTSIGAGAFSGCTKLASATFPDSVTRIGYNVLENTAYRNNPSNWEDGMLYVGKHLLEAQPSLSGECAIRAGTKTVADSAFWNCESLTSIIIPNGVTSIGDSVFLYCESLTSITIPNGVTRIGNSAFIWCESLVSITIPDSVKIIGRDAFLNCYKLANVFYTGTEKERFQIQIADGNDVLEAANGATWTYNVVPFGTFGDVNSDGNIDSTDARLTLQYFVGSVGAGDLNLNAADVNGDSSVDSTDARLILQYFVGSITEFPAV